MVSTGMEIEYYSILRTLQVGDKIKGFIPAADMHAMWCRYALGVSSGCWSHWVVVNHQWLQVICHLCCSWTRRIVLLFFILFHCRLGGNLLHPQLQVLRVEAPQSSGSIGGVDNFSSQVVSTSLLIIKEVTRWTDHLSCHRCNYTWVPLLLIFRIGALCVLSVEFRL